ncbi:hypothetical protein [Naasia lichenicola]|uniref:Uncharacterized protein n=1 Tax=Naasia lichenicola TaxID=2565933 RepID=A0A4S4FI95_9MICO|nr:hypothetical protein [Naasia lichenicola]THG30040.1 hypothetical protein E6C64_15490 [Naasia lichenicola]
MAYTAERPPQKVTSEQLRDLIPGWGSDLDTANRPAWPKERFDPGASGAHWDFPERQTPEGPRERSIEHRFLTPVFGTAQPTRGTSGLIRRFAYARFSEARAAHWLLLVAADRVDFVGSRATALLKGRPDNPISETGILSEVSRHGIASRMGTPRVDLRHSWMDPILVAAPWVVGGYLALRVGRAFISRGR